MKPIITIAGTVGVGKSTLTQGLADYFGFQTAFEAVGTNPYLEDFYQDYSTWSFRLQICFLAERFKQQKWMFETGGGFVQDRSIYEDKEIFAKNLYDGGFMTETDYQTYISLFEAMIMTPYFPKPDVLIYLNGPLGEIKKRVIGRGRKMEQNQPDSYWEDLYHRYENWIYSFNECPVIRVDITEYDIKEKPESIRLIAEKVQSIIGVKQK